VAPARSKKRRREHLHFVWAPGSTQATIGRHVVGPGQSADRQQVSQAGLLELASPPARSSQWAQNDPGCAAWNGPAPPPLGRRGRRAARRASPPALRSAPSRALAAPRGRVAPHWPPVQVTPPSGVPAARAAPSTTPSCSSRLRKPRNAPYRSLFSTGRSGDRRHRQHSSSEPGWLRTLRRKVAV
jgi:hypothetical protein